MGRDSLMNSTEQHKAKNTESKNQDKIARLSMRDAKNYLEKKYKNAEFKIVNKLSYAEISINLKIFIPDLDDKLQYDGKHGIAPDGGLLFIKFKKSTNWFCISALERKRQGGIWPSEEKESGVYSIGNADERAAMNIELFKRYCINEDITPYLCFCDGSAFKDEYGAGAKCRCPKLKLMNFGLPFNKIHLNTQKNGMMRPISIFTRFKEWNTKEMTKYILEMSIKSINYYKNRYKV